MGKRPYELIGFLMFLLTTNPGLTRSELVVLDTENLVKLLKISEFFLLTSYNKTKLFNTIFSMHLHFRVIFHGLHRAKFSN